MSGVGAGSGWSLRPYRPGDEDALVELFAAVFGRPVDLAAWRWKLKGRRSPVENVWVAVADDGRVIAQYAGIPVRLRLAGRERWAMQSVDTMVSPAFRRRGILTALGTSVYASWAEGGVSAVFGVPNQNWGSRTDALGLQPVLPLAWLRSPLHAGAALARALRLRGTAAAPLVWLGDALAAGWRGARSPRDGGVRLEPVRSAGEEFDSLWARAAAGLDNAVVRDASWIEWRYLQTPGPPYTVLLARRGGEPVGYVAYRLAGSAEHRSGLVADLLAIPEAEGAARVLLAAALDDLLARGAEAAHAAAPRSGTTERTLRRAGFLRRRGSSQVVLAALTPEVDPAALRRPGRWLLSAGDFDVV